jgi:hypothetical protein
MEFFFLLLAVSNRRATLTLYQQLCRGFMPVIAG